MQSNKKHALAFNVHGFLIRERNSSRTHFHHQSFGFVVAQHFLKERSDRDPTRVTIRAAALNMKVGQLFKLIPVSRTVKQGAIASLSYFNDEMKK